MSLIIVSSWLSHSRPLLLAAPFDPLDAPSPFGSSVNGSPLGGVVSLGFWSVMGASLAGSVREPRRDRLHCRHAVDSCICRAAPSGYRARDRLGMVRSGRQPPRDRAPGARRPPPPGAR